ncbi:phosphotransferase [Nonomuraea sp. NPDC004580]|uniref:phosphotransferase n=1 Tax=Nonomuraea sp. NPDC004580 TaxID=3154552 RepID=UPI0033B698BA
MPDEEILTGGGVNHVVKVAGTVRRPTGPWTPAVHALLRHLAARGFTGAPSVHGVDEQGREVLGFVPGETAGHPLPPWARTDEALTGAARLLRRYHDATAGFVPPPGATWYLPPVEPAEVICHGDVAAAGDAAFAGHVARGDDRFYETDMAHLRRHAGRLTCRTPR